MRKYIAVFFSVSLFLLSCNKDKSANQIIDHSRMVKLLIDIHTVDGRMYNRVVPDSMYKYGAGMYMAVFKKYKTDSVQFRKSFNYYTTQPEEMQAIYEEVLKNFKQKTDSLNKILKRPVNALP